MIVRRSTSIPKITVLMLGFLLIAIAFPALAQTNFETPRPLKATDILPEELLEGPFHKIDTEVLNDGYMNTYTIHSQFGKLTAVSTVSLKERLEELKAIDAMRKVEQTDTFQESVADAAETTVEGVKNIIEDPKGAFSGAVTGIGKAFKRAGEAIQSRPGAGEDSRFEGLIGYSNTKREYAYAFGVDVYSPNPILQEQLDAMAQTGYAGSLSVTALKALIPGGVGMALSVTGGTQLLNDVISKSPPTELRTINRGKLTEMNISPQLIDLFINTTVFSIRDQTLLVAALKQLPQTRGRSEFIKFAISTDSEDLARFAPGRQLCMPYTITSRHPSKALSIWSRLSWPKQAIASSLSCLWIICSGLETPTISSKISTKRRPTLTELTKNNSGWPEPYLSQAGKV